MKNVESWLSGKNGLWYYHIRNEQGQIISTSTSCFSKQHCLSEITIHLPLTQENEIEQLPPMVHSLKTPRSDDTPQQHSMTLALSEIALHIPADNDTNMTSETT